MGYKLRELNRNDMHVINKWRNDPELIKYVLSPFRYINAETDEMWFDNYMRSRNNAVRCGIVNYESEERLIGCIYLLDIDWVARNTELGIMIGEEKDRNCGAGTFAVKAILRHAFNDLNLHRVQLELLKENVRAHNLYLKCGFQDEGLKRDAIFKNGEYADILTMGILKSDYAH